MTIKKDKTKNLIYSERERIRLKDTNDYYYITRIENLFHKTWYYLGETIDEKNSYMCVMYNDLVKVS